MAGTPKRVRELDFCFWPARRTHFQTCSRLETLRLELETVGFAMNANLKVGPVNSKRNLFHACLVTDPSSVLFLAGDKLCIGQTLEETFVTLMYNS